MKDLEKGRVLANVWVAVFPLLGVRTAFVTSIAIKVSVAVEVVQALVPSALIWITLGAPIESSTVRT